MVRPKEFVVEDALEAAMEVFWRQGYAATSLLDLTGAMGLSKSSFYETFGGKHDLFLEALKQYRHTAVREMAGVLEGDRPGREAIERVFSRTVKNAVTPEGRRGCLLCNSAVELSMHDPDVAKEVAVGLDRMKKAFRQAVVRGQADRTVSRRHDPRDLASYLVAGINGMLVLAKASPSRSVLKNVMRINLSVLG